MDGTDRVCSFCDHGPLDQALYGPSGVLHHDNNTGLSSHSYCMYFSCALAQTNENPNFFDGFDPADVKKELGRSRRLRCIYCKKGYASIGCVVSRCKSMYHYICARQNGMLLEHFGNFRSLCERHRPTPKRAPDFTSDPPPSCVICLTDLETTDQVLVAPCCTISTMFHHDCIQTYAMSSGMHAFKCPVCNNVDKFQADMRIQGIDIPDKDAAWELEPDAFEELQQLPAKCHYDRCKCPFGPDFDDDDGVSAWDIWLCNACGYKGRHRGCQYFQKSTWTCEECAVIIQKVNKMKSEHIRPESKVLPPKKKEKLTKSESQHRRRLNNLLWRLKRKYNVQNCSIFIDDIGKWFNKNSSQSNGRVNMENVPLFSLQTYKSPRTSTKHGVGTSNTKLNTSSNNVQKQLTTPVLSAKKSGKSLSTKHTKTPLSSGKKAHTSTRRNDRTTPLRSNKKPNVNTHSSTKKARKTLAVDRRTPQNSGKGKGKGKTSRKTYDTTDNDFTQIKSKQQTPVKNMPDNNTPGVQTLTLQTPAPQLHSPVGSTIPPIPQLTPQSNVSTILQSPIYGAIPHIPTLTPQHHSEPQVNDINSPPMLSEHVTIPLTPLDKHSTSSKRKCTNKDKHSKSSQKKKRRTQLKFGDSNTQLGVDIKGAATSIACVSRTSISTTSTNNTSTIPTITNTKPKMTSMGTQIDDITITNSQENDMSLQITTYNESRQIKSDKVLPITTKVSRYCPRKSMLVKRKISVSPNHSPVRSLQAGLDDVKNVHCSHDMATDNSGEQNSGTSIASITRSSRAASSPLKRPTIVSSPTRSPRLTITSVSSLGKGIDKLLPTPSLSQFRSSTHSPIRHRSADRTTSKETTSTSQESLPVNSSDCVTNSLIDGALFKDITNSPMKSIPSKSTPLVDTHRSTPSKLILDNSQMTSTESTDITSSQASTRSMSNQPSTPNKSTPNDRQLSNSSLDLASTQTESTPSDSLPSTPSKRNLANSPSKRVLSENNQESSPTRRTPNTRSRESTPNRGPPSERRQSGTPTRSTSSQDRISRSTSVKRSQTNSPARCSPSKRSRANTPTSCSPSKRSRATTPTRTLSSTQSENILSESSAVSSRSSTPSKHSLLSTPERCTPCNSQASITMNTRSATSTPSGNTWSENLESTPNSGTGTGSSTPHTPTRQTPFSSVASTPSISTFMNSLLNEPERTSSQACTPTMNSSAFESCLSCPASESSLLERMPTRSTPSKDSQVNTPCKGTASKDSLATTPNKNTPSDSKLASNFSSTPCESDSPSKNISLSTRSSSSSTSQPTTPTRSTPRRNSASTPTRNTPSKVTLLTSTLTKNMTTRSNTPIKDTPIKNTLIKDTPIEDTTTKSLLTMSFDSCGNGTSTDAPAKTGPFTSSPTKSAHITDGQWSPRKCSGSPVKNMISRDTISPAKNTRSSASIIDCYSVDQDQKVDEIDDLSLTHEEYMLIERTCDAVKEHYCHDAELISTSKCDEKLTVQDSLLVETDSKTVTDHDKTVAKDSKTHKVNKLNKHKHHMRQGSITQYFKREVLSELEDKLLK